MKNPILAATLNLIPLGFGYLYLKEYSRFALTIFGGVASIFLVLLVMMELTYMICGWDPCRGTEPLILAPLALPLMLSLFTMIDAARISKKSRPR
jgi:hypothetical protein